jgi:tRNA (guanine-N7-)-methyltransferase
MMLLYRMITNCVYCLAWIVGRAKAARGNAKWRGRLGLIEPVGPKDIWMHAASVGEVKVLTYLLHYLKKQEPHLSVHVTVMTEAGFKTALRTVADADDSVSVSFFPLDAAPVVRRTLERIQPRLLVIAETELWPNCIRLAARKKIPIILVNGRMSEKAFRMYGYIRTTLTGLLAKYDRFFFKTEADASRYRYFGVSLDKAVVAGDMKFDAPLMPRSEGRRREMRARVGAVDDDFLFVAGSTRPGEETALLNVYSAIHDKHPHFKLVMAPRHLERLPEVEALLQQRGISYAVYGEAEPGTSVVLINRMGILNELYLAADLAFVGGTLVDIGGHNILEPVWAGTPVIFGPYLSNVSEAAEYILTHDYGAKVASEQELTILLKNVLAGQRTFRVKTTNDLNVSPSATVGRYILQRLKHA